MTTMLLSPRSRTRIRKLKNRNHAQELNSKRQIEEEIIKKIKKLTILQKKERQRDFD